MMEVTIHWAAMLGNGSQRYLVDVPSVPSIGIVGGRPNPFDATQADTAIDVALKAFRALPPLVERRLHESNREWPRAIQRIDLRQSEDVVLQP